MTGKLITHSDITISLRSNVGSKYGKLGVGVFLFIFDHASFQRSWHIFIFLPNTYVEIWSNSMQIVNTQSFRNYFYNSWYRLSYICIILQMFYFYLILSLVSNLAHFIGAFNLKIIGIQQKTIIAFIQPRFKSNLK